jgi:hypothetical protein
MGGNNQAHVPISVFFRSALVAVALLCSACQRESLQAHPWECWRTTPNPVQFRCVESRKPTSNEAISWWRWHWRHDADLAIGYECRGWLDEAVCVPIFSEAARHFDDGTAPHFQCIWEGDEDEIGPHEGDTLACQPYWRMSADERQQRGSGWFLWLALQANGEERRQLIAVASDYERRVEQRIQQELKQAGAEMRSSPSPTPNDFAAASALLNQIQREQDARKNRTAEQIRTTVESEIRAWKYESASR